MRAIKINDSLIRIVISEKELWDDYSLELDDFAKGERKQELSKILVDIVRTACNKLHLEVPKGLNLKLTITENGIILEAELSPVYSTENLRGMANYIRDNLMGLNEDEFLRILDKMGLTPENEDELLSMLEEEGAIPHEETPKVKQGKKWTYLLGFNSIDEILTFINVSNLEDVLESALYKLNDKYYLSITLFKEKDLSYIILEFNIEEEPITFEWYLSEHGFLMLENAFDTLKKI